MATNFLSASGSVFTVGSPCGEEGAAMYDRPSTTSMYPWPSGLATGPHCWRMTAHPVVIGPDYMSQDQAIKIVNFDFSTNGDQPGVPNTLGLRGAIG
jgi:hypothetical protein